MLRLPTWIPGRSVALLQLAICGVLTGQDTVGTGTIRGTVTGDGGTPASSVRVCVEGTRQCALTDNAGRFSSLDARPGVTRLEITPGSGGALLSSEIDVRAGLTSEVLLELPEIASVSTSVTVGATEVLTPDEVVTSGVRVPSRVVSKSAGTLQDVSRYVATLPGVVTGSADFRNDIIVRGGSPLENLFVVDNIEIPNINSFANLTSAGGTVSLVDVNLIEDVTFLTGGYPAPYVNRLSSVMQIAQREGSRERFRALGTFAYAGAGGVLEAPWAGDKGSWIVSARRSFLDWFTSDLGTGGVPIYYSFTTKVVRDFGVRDRIWATSIGGIDEIRLGLTEDSEPMEVLSTLDIRYGGRRNATGVNWQRIFGSRGVGLLGVSHSRATVDSTVKDLVRDGAYAVGADVAQTIESGAVTFRQDSTEAETTLKYDLTIHAGATGELRAGVAQKFFANDYVTRSPFGYDGPFTLVPDINPIDLQERLPANQGALYLQSTHELSGRVRLSVGLRYDRYAQFGAARSRLSPRAGLAVSLGRNVSWNTSWGIYHQLPVYLFMAAFPQNRELLPARSEHWVSGIGWTPGRNLRVTIEAYDKRYRDYAVSSQFPSVSLANVGDTFDVRDILYPMTSAGRGRTRGIELFAEKRYDGDWFGQVNLAYSRARHAGLDRVLRPGAFDRPIAFNLVGGKRIGRKWEAAVRYSYLSGRPYTPFREDLSEAQRRGIFDLERVNALRYAPFVTLDLRLDRTYKVGDQVAVVYFGLQNVLGRRNDLGVLWNRLTNGPSVGEGTGRFPLVGLEWFLR